MSENVYFSPVSAFSVYQTQLKPKTKNLVQNKHISTAKKLNKNKLAGKQLSKKRNKVLENGDLKGVKKIDIILARERNIVKKKKVKKASLHQNGDIKKRSVTKESVKKNNLKKLKSKNKSTKNLHVISEVDDGKFANVNNLKTDSLDQAIQGGEKNRDDPSKEALNVFKWLISPMSTKTFFDTIWEKDVVHIKRKHESKYYSNIFSSDCLDTILRENTLYYTQNIDVVSYENGVKEVHNQEGRAVPAALWDFYLNGCSIRVLNPQTYCQPIHLLISTLQENFGTMVGTNVYLTPPDSQGFAPHYDDIEAFIVQLEGRKHWKLYKPKGKDVLARESSPNFKPEELGKPFSEVTLNAGDLLYFPRGTIHEGRTDSEAHSLHITVSVYQHTAYADLLEQIIPVALQRAADSDVHFRNGLPLNYLKHVGCVNKDIQSDTRREILQTVKHLMQTVINYIDVDLGADQLGRKFMHDAMPPVLSKTEVKHTSAYDGDYMRNGQVFNRVEISLDTRVRLLRYYSLRIVDEPTSAKLYYCIDNARVYHASEEQWLEIDKNLIPCIKTLQNYFPKYIAVENLPVEDEIAKIQLVADLWEKGLLATDEPLPTISESDDESSM